ncbi:sulfate ABC transporter substrate-binding protein [Roseburia sp. AM59-24XD]|jgi:sulfate/thiosulfate-binding protein|uniref:sulfate ABC transporter substrate-binding protein n=1 Tax=Roseburia sp. AM59-24XD TaxID=2293138 RepID=UPI000E53C81D|nr:sulfate ABC transporter substrate-binding protein [Roseburia sp. AM59-24XD]RHP87584.1 sulfate ABC transporter substrate-binding protein [Roseburia sp. AM59-24XD]
MKNKLIALLLTTVVAAGTVLTGCSGQNKETASKDAKEITITNVSYDPTREFYAAYDELFQKHWQKEKGQTVKVTASHGGSGSQARSVIEGNEADVVTLALAHDITAIQDAGLIEDGWMDEFDKDSSPYTSTIVFLVRKGNDKDIHDWNDLVRTGVDVITPNPKTSGGACWNFLAAWAYAREQFDNDEEQIKKFMKKLYQNVLVLDSGARGATSTFVEKGQGDVLIAWENEAYLSMEEYPDDYEIVTPSISILAQPSVAVVDSVAKKRGTEEVAREYLNYLYSDDAQRLAGENYYRPSNEKILKEFSDQFNLDMNLVTIDDFGGWDQAFKNYFDDGAVFDQIYSE